MLGSKKGQAMMELLPSTILFFMVISVSLAYYRVVRASQLRQEAVRNMMFAKIANKGTLTSTGVQEDQGVVFSQGDQGFRGPAAISSNQNSFVDQTVPCFSVSPSDLSFGVPFPESIAGLGRIPQLVNIATYAVMHRDSGGTCP